MQRAVCLLAGLFALSSAADAAVLTLVSDRERYEIGETIVLTLTGRTLPSDVAFGAFVRIEFDAALTIPISASQQPPHQGKRIFPVTHGRANVQEGYAHLIDQIYGLTSPASVNTWTPTVATATLVAESSGVVRVRYFVDPAQPGLTMNYFGITSQPGITFRIVPEPGTAALVGLGLLALACGARRA